MWKNIVAMAFGNRSGFLPAVFRCFPSRDFASANASGVVL